MNERQKEITQLSKLQLSTIKLLFTKRIGAFNKNGLLAPKRIVPSLKKIKGLKCSNNKISLLKYVVCVNICKRLNYFN